MEEILATLLGCVVVVGIPLAIIVTAVRLHVRLKDVEKTLRELRDEVTRLRAGVPVTGIETAPEDAVDVEAPAFADTVAVVPAAALPREEIPQPATDEPASEDAEPVDEEAPAEETAPAPAFVPPEPPPAPSRGWGGFEELVGAKLLVWVGAVAIALGGAFMVKLGFTQLGPTFRVTFGILLGISLLVAGEWLRRNYAYLAQGTSSAGIAALFAAFYAATSLYGFVGPIPGFLLMALTTATAVALSLRQGVVVATVGLVGGFLTPALVGDDESRPALLFGYLLLLQLGLVAVTRRRRWSLLGGLTLAAGFLWVLFFLSQGFRPQDAGWVGLFIVLSVAAFVFSVFGGAGDTAWGNVAVARLMGWGALGGGMLVGGKYLAAADYGPMGWVFVGVLGAGCLAVGRLDEKQYQGVPWLAALVTAGLLLGWNDELDSAPSTAFFVTLGLLGALFAGGAFAAHFRAVYPGRWASLSASAAVVFFLAAFARGERQNLELTWGAIALGLAALYVVGLVPALRRHKTGDAAAAAPLAALAVAATTLLSLAVPLELEREWLSVAWAFEVWALLFLAGELKVPALRKMAWILGGLVVVRLVFNPMVLEYPIGENVILNWLAYGYGLPCVAFFMALRLARRQEARPLAEALASALQALVLVFLTLLVRHYFHPSDLDGGDFYLAEWGTYSIVWLLLAHALMTASTVFPEAAFRWGTHAVLAGTVLTGTVALGLVDNPLWSHQSVGGTVLLNRVLWCYGLPAVLLAFAAVRHARRQERAPASFAGVAALLTIFLFATLEVRQYFHGNYLDTGSVSLWENLMYSLAWLALGCLLMAGGVRWRQRPLRLAAMAVLVLVVCKVFIVDSSGLEGGFRVASFMGLGFALLALAFLYQRFVVPLAEAARREEP